MIDELVPISESVIFIANISGIAPILVIPHAFIILVCYLCLAYM